jgi:hypothetical protein
LLVAALTIAWVYNAKCCRSTAGGIICTGGFDQPGALNDCVTTKNECTKFDALDFIRSNVFANKVGRRLVGIFHSTSVHCIPACASSVVELWFAVADFPKGVVGADVVAKAALLTLLLRHVNR